MRLASTLVGEGASSHPALASAAPTPPTVTAVPRRAWTRVVVGAAVGAVLGVLLFGALAAGRLEVEGGPSADVARPASPIVSAGLSTDVAPGPSSARAAPPGPPEASARQPGTPEAAELGGAIPAGPASVVAPGPVSVAPRVAGGPTPTETSPSVSNVWEVQFQLNSNALVTAAMAPSWTARCAHFTVVGHACGLGSPAVNDALGLARAEAVRGLLTRAGVPPQNVTVQTVGSNDPAAAESSEEGRRRNRRAVVTCDAWEHP